MPIHLRISMISRNNLDPHHVKWTHIIEPILIFKVKAIVCKFIFQPIDWSVKQKLAIFEKVIITHILSKCVAGKEKENMSVSKNSVKACVPGVMNHS